MSWNKNSSGVHESKSSQPPCEAVSWNSNAINITIWHFGQPPCEAVSWNAVLHTPNLFPSVSLLVRLWVEITALQNLHPCLHVSLLVRLWVEISIYHHLLSNVWLSASLWGCELKYLRINYNVIKSWSASLWGCELKCDTVLLLLMTYHVSLLVRLWVEIRIINSYSKKEQGQPPCEAVSWNFSTFIRMCEECSQPPCEAVSWNSTAFWLSSAFKSQPPCEAVSWNNLPIRLFHFLPGQPPCEAVSWNINSQCSTILIHGQPPCEAVSWNINSQCSTILIHGQPPCEAVSWNIIFVGIPCKYLVSLLVRLWVEIFCFLSTKKGTQSASLWGCELKFWNFFQCFVNCKVSLLVRLWVEILVSVIIIT